jgi:hypothetical protein
MVDTADNWFGEPDLEPKSRHIVLFVPSLTRDGDSLNHEYWRDETVLLMSRLFGGATAVQAYGGWLDEEYENRIKMEPVTAVVSFASEEECNINNAIDLRRFLHRMGREAQQGEVAVLVDGVLMRFQRF